MVYHIKKVSNRTAVKMACIDFVIKWAIYAFLCCIVLQFNDLSEWKSYIWWLMLAMALPAAVVAALQFRGLQKNTKSYEELFYTLTEGGLLVESAAGQMRSFISWSEVTSVHRILSHTVYIQLTGGQGINCLLEGLPEARISEFATFAEEHAGTTPPASALTRPPVNLTAEAPLVFSATPEQRRELADAKALLTSPAWVWTWWRPVLLLLFCSLFVYSAYGAEYVDMVILAFIIWRIAAKLCQPGGATENLRHICSRQYYADHNQILIMFPESGSWVCTWQDSPRAVYHLPHGTCLEDKDGVLMVDANQPLSEHLQTAPQRLPKILPRPAIFTLLGCMFLGAVWGFTQSNTWRLHQLVNSETPDIREALRLVELPPSTPVVRAYVFPADESVNILYHSYSGGEKPAVTLYLVLHHGDTVCASFNQYAELIDCEQIRSSCDDDATEYAEEAAAAES